MASRTHFGSQRLVHIEHRCRQRIAQRMNARNEQPFDFYLLPRIDLPGADIRLAEENEFSLDAYRFDTLDVLYALAARSRVREAA